MTRERLNAARLYLLFTPAVCHSDPWATLEAALDAGVDLVQWRQKAPGGADPAADLAHCVELCDRRNVPVIVNDDPSAAVAAGAAGAHVGQEDMPAPRAREILGDDLWLGVSTHDPEQVAAAAAAGAADHLGFGPCFPTATKGYSEGTALPLMAAAIEAAGPLPVFAIGGIGPDNIAEVLARGARRIAVSSAILAAPDPAAAVRLLRARLGRDSG